jgi:predicted ATP-dependent protease
VLVDRAAASAPEVVFCDHPTYANLLGRIDHIQHLGTLVTDFTLLKAGALHRANGGYLVADGYKVLTQPFAWESLKRALTRREVRIEPPSELWGLGTGASLEPEPVPLRVKVVLIGGRYLYYLLQALDPDFPRLFKVVADFEDTLERNAGSSAALARAIAATARREALLPLERAAVARVLDESARRASDSRKLSADIAATTSLMREADFVARAAARGAITAGDVDAAAEAQRERSGRIKRRVDEAIARGTLVIETAGARIGQVNGLSVVDLGEFPFAEPTRITATTRVGEGQVIDIQREARLGGAIHSKGVMILSELLAARFSCNHPHSLAASLVFEQTYGPVEGDSASLAELCALLSSLGGVALRQSLAVTGSVDQLGDVQAVGAVNEKIEGFFDVCRARGLDGSHGVVIPAANVEHLMLRDRVVEAAAQGLFRVYPVRTVDEAVELLTGLPAGAPDAAAAAPDSINGRVARRLREFARVRAEALRPGRGVRGAARRR